MRFQKIFAAALLLLLALAGSVSAQVGGYNCINDYIDCNLIYESSMDDITIVEFTGRPGDTIWMPVRLKTQDTTSGFLVLIEFDSSMLKPYNLTTDELWGHIQPPPVDTTDKMWPDTLFMHYQLAGQLLAAQEQQDAIDDTKEVFFAQLSEQSADSGHAVIICAFNLGFTGSGGDSTQVPPRMEPTSGELIFRLPFITDSNVVQDEDSAFFQYREVNEFVVIDSGMLTAFCADCRRTNMSVDRDCESWVYDTIATVPELLVDTLLDTVTCTSVLYPTTNDGWFHADATPDPDIQSFSSNMLNDSVGTNNGFLLLWAVSNTDSVFITGPDVDFASGDTSITPQLYVTSPSTPGTYPYTLIARNQNSDDTATVSMLVQDGGGDPPPDPHQPQINVSTVHYVDVGNTLVFTVSATDPDNDFITLEATSLPTNATFPTVTGTGSASGTFTFTPTMSQGGTVTATFRARDDITSPVSVTVQINVAEPAYDKLFTSSTERSARGGIDGKPSFLFPVNLVTSQTVYGVQFDFLFDEQNFNVNNVLTNINTAEYVIYHNIGATPGEVRVLAFGMANEPIGTDGTEILQIDMGVEGGALSGQYPVYFNAAWESVNPDPDFPSLPLLADTGVIQVDMFGDVNLNLNVDVADLVSVVGYIIEAYTFDQRKMDVGDVNFDANVDVFDLVAIINMILTGTSPVSPGLYYEDQFAKVQLDYDDLERGVSGMVVVSSELPTDIAGVELEILYDPATVFLGKPQLGEDASFMSINSSNNGGGKLKVLLHSGNLHSSGLINSGLADLVEIPVTANQHVASGDTVQIRLNKALLATSSASAVPVVGLDAPLPISFKVAQNYPNPFNPTTTIEFSFGPRAKNVRLDIFNIIGQKVTTLINDFLPPGQHQVEWNSAGDNGQKVASGVYLYKLQVGQESQTKKMLLLK